MKTSIYIDREDVRKTEEQEKFTWTINVISNIGITSDELEIPENVEELSVEFRKNMRALLQKFDVKIVDEHDGNIKIYVEDNLIAEWHKPQYILRTDLSAIEPSKRLFVEMITDHWSVFDGEDNE